MTPNTPSHEEWNERQAEDRREERSEVATCPVGASCVKVAAAAMARAFRTGRDDDKIRVERAINALYQHRDVCPMCGKETPADA